ncbi:MAG: PIN domain-containing protein [Coriobacteriales bacterium]|jgi:predicted nucleic acid-binding protein|nr:PIN domain-containing protein [Coriobacteriales bacterium]
MRVLVDTNVLLDYLAKREPYLKSSEGIFSACSTGRVDGCVAVHSFPNIFYILRKIYTIAERRSLLLDLCHLFSVEGIDRSTVEAAIRNESFDDFEDALQEECAKAFGADFIVTRNPKDFAASEVPIVSPDDFMKMLGGYELGS